MMRPPNGVFCCCVVLCVAGALAHSPTGIPLRLRASSSDGFQHALRNETSRMTYRPILWDAYGQLVDSLPPGYKWLYPQYTKMKLRGTRTARTSYESTPSKVSGHPTPPINLAISFSLWKSLVIVGLGSTVVLLASLEDVLAAVECIGQAWLGFSSDVEDFVLFVIERALIVSRDLLRSFDTSMSLLFIHLSKQWCFLSTLVSGFLQKEKIHQSKDRHLASAERKPEAAIPPPKTPRRPFGKHFNTPAFGRDTKKKLTFLYLREEDRSLRHMCNPRHFNLVKKVGTGSFGTVYQIEHRITGQMLAMKAMSREHNTDDDFALEMRAQLRLQDGIWFPKISCTFMNFENYYFIMPFYHRGDLYAFMTSCGGCLPRNLAKFYLAELLLAIHGLHSCGVIHRDLKPENILFTDDGHLIVADLGVAHIFDVEGAYSDEFLEDEFPLWAELKCEGGDDFPLLTASVDNPHVTIGYAGTDFYSAPEVRASEEYSYGVDYYAMAIIYHEMVTGYVPYHLGNTPPDECDPEPILDLGRKDSHYQPISVTDRKFLMKVLNKDPFARPSVKKMKKDPVFGKIKWDKMAKQQAPIPPVSTKRKRVPISTSLDRCLTPVG